MLRVAWSGHRPIYFKRPDEARAVVDKAAAQILRRHGSKVLFVTGGQLGVDLWAAEAARALGGAYEVCLPQPFDAFVQEWEIVDQKRLETVAVGASSVWVAPPSADPFGARNQRLVDTADRLEVVWVGLKSGGTWDTIYRARRAGLSIRFHRCEWSGTTPARGARGV